MLSFQRAPVCRTVNFFNVDKTHSAYRSRRQFVRYLTRKLILTLPQSSARVRQIIRDRGEARELFKKSITSEERRQAGFAYGTRHACFSPGVRKRFVSLAKHEHACMLQKEENDKIFLVVRTISSNHQFFLSLFYSFFYSLFLSLSLSIFLNCLVFIGNGP